MNKHSKWITFKKQQLIGSIIQYGEFTIKITEKHPNNYLTYKFIVMK